MHITAIEKLLGPILIEGLSLGLLIVDTDYRIVRWNRWMERESGIMGKDILLSNIFEQFPDIQERKIDQFIKKCFENRRPVFMSSFFHKYLIRIDIFKNQQDMLMKQDIKMYPIFEEDKVTGVVIIIEDVTERILHEAEILRINRILRSVRKVTQLITRVSSEEKLFLKSAEIIARDTDASLVWFTMIPVDLEVDGASRLSIAAFEGIEADNFKKMIKQHSKFYQDLSLTEKAIQTKEMQITYRLKDEPAFKKWWDLFKNFQSNAVIALPLKIENRVISVLHIHYEESHSVHPHVIELFQELANDISFCVDQLHNRKMRKKAETIIKDEKERLRVTLHSIGDGVITTDTDGNVVLLNAVAQELTGWKEADAIGRNITEVFHIINEYTLEPCVNPVDKVMEKGIIVGLANHTALIAKNGTRRIIADSGAPIKNDEGRITGVVLVFRDITEQKRMKDEKNVLEVQLRQAQKMESIGTLTGGIAHDFNNIMGIILGNAELALVNVPKWNPAHSSLEEIKKASLRAANIVRQLLSFSRKTDQKLQPMKIAMVIKDALKFLRSTIPTTIDIEQDIFVTSETILADPTQINQIMMNLCINASHAMEQTGGKLTIIVENVTLDDNSAKDYPDLKSGKHIKVVVSDTGSGIDPKIIDRIFDPYFTTKGVGKGSGMGLAVVHGIVKSHSGSITVDSTLGKGTKFSILFPLAQGKAAVEAQTIQEIPRGSETILFVDDEISIVNMVQRMFEHLGYKVQTAMTPQDALDRFALNPDYFDLVITDMTMPQMTGVNLSEKLMAIRPDIPIIICTGYSVLVDEEKAKELGLAAYVMKPINLSEIAQTIRKVLDRNKN